MPCATDVFAARSMVMRLAKVMHVVYRMQMDADGCRILQIEMQVLVPMTAGAS